MSPSRYQLVFKALRPTTTTVLRVKIPAIFSRIDLRLRYTQHQVVAPLLVISLVAVAIDALLLERKMLLLILPCLSCLSSYFLTYFCLYLEVFNSCWTKWSCSCIYHISPSTLYVPDCVVLI